MPSRRDQISMSAAEVQEFLAAQRVLTVGTVGRDGRPHLTALWFVMRAAEPWIFTYGRSQKVKNLERDPRVTLLAESGVEYGELRGVMLETTAEINTDPGTVAEVAEELFLRYEGRGNDGADGISTQTRAAVRERAAKRVAIRLAIDRTVSWDHSKLGGTY